eukprot:gnl/MRDRNA2_/MRDRNA2_449997_c0_seq1.p1 gnl/MRDRNA2_/MRDRNA2_449997_c0~~gnl/MRDRNA2_/MRDRNA2_449997_c0_seq1.p1  ORF type:complete len:142 (+),score=22.95 gnl/MRDRNA2_/MRDRNA2_449997_c0_seq1:31-426(+)
MIHATSPMGEQDAMPERPQSQPVWAAPVHHMLQHRQPSFLTQNGVASAPVFAQRGTASAPRPHRLEWASHSLQGLPPYPMHRDGRSPRDEEGNGVPSPGFHDGREQQSTQQGASPGGGALTPFNPPVRSSS